MPAADVMVRRFQKRRRKPPPVPRYQGGEAGPPIPGLGQAQRERIKRINQRYIDQQNARADRSINPRDRFATPADKKNYRPRRKRPTMN